MLGYLLTHNIDHAATRMMLDQSQEAKPHSNEEESEADLAYSLEGSKLDRSYIKNDMLPQSIVSSLLHAHNRK